jgi:hypothetical protein
MEGAAEAGFSVEHIGVEPKFIPLCGILSAGRELSCLAGRS